MTKPMKKVEIVIDAHHLRLVLQELDKAKVGGYSVVGQVTGKGERGTRGGDELTGVFTNIYVMCACLPEVAERITQRIAPLLKTHGGVCLVSDCGYVEH